MLGRAAAVFIGGRRVEAGRGSWPSRRAADGSCPPTDTIVDRFTRQRCRSRRRRRFVRGAAVDRRRGAGASDTVLDVACGPGLVACAFARLARRDRHRSHAGDAGARAAPRDQGQADQRHRAGRRPALPYVDASFSIVVSRFAFHLPDPAAVRPNAAGVPTRRPGRDRRPMARPDPPRRPPSTAWNAARSLTPAC